MRKTIQSLFLVSCLASVGCAKIAGHWEAVAVRPASAVDSFSMGKADFRCDGTYEAEMKYDGEMHTSAGTYEYEGCTLTLMPKEGEVRHYQAKMNLGGDKLTIVHEEDDHKAEVDLKRIKKCCKGKCPNASKCKAKCDKSKCAEKTASNCPPGCTKECCKGKCPHASKCKSKCDKTKCAENKTAHCPPGCTKKCCSKA